MLVGCAVFRRKDADGELPSKHMSLWQCGTDAMAAEDEIFRSGCGNGEHVTSSKYRDGTHGLIS